MFFPSLRAHLTQALPAPIQAKLGLPPQPQQQQGAPQPDTAQDQYNQTPYAASQPPLAQNELQQKQLLSPSMLSKVKRLLKAKAESWHKPKPTPGQPEQLPPAGQGLPPQGKFSLKAKVAEWRKKLPHFGPKKNHSPEQGPQAPAGAASNKPNPAIPAEAPPGSAMARGVDPSVPGARIRPYTVDELFWRMPKRFVHKPPKFTLTPDEIRVNYPRKQQECLERMVYALPWKDDDMINPFYTSDY